MRRKKAIGRPKSANPASATLLLKMTPAQKSSFQKKATRAGLPLGTWLKHLAEKAD